MLSNPHPHIYNCDTNESAKKVCVACRWDAAQRVSKEPLVLTGKTFEQMLNTSDEELLRDMLINIAE